jgi:phospholipid-translocating ATPase
VDNLSLVIDGKSLTGLFRNPSSVKQLQALSMRCETVVACRLSPIQKSQLVRLVKGKGPPKRYEQLHVLT